MFVFRFVSFPCIPIAVAFFLRTKLTHRSFLDPAFFSATVVSGTNQMGCRTTSLQGDGAREWLSDEPIFESLDDALEWCEEQLLYEISSSTAELAASSSSSSSSSASRKQQQPSYPKPSLSKLLNPELVARMGGKAKGKASSKASSGMDDSSSGGGRPGSPVLDPLSRHPSYYFGLQQSRISPSSAASASSSYFGGSGGSRGGGGGDGGGGGGGGSPASPVMALVSILEDYLQIAPQDSPLRPDAARAPLELLFAR